MKSALALSEQRDAATRRRLNALLEQVLGMVGGFKIPTPLGEMPANVLLGPFRPKIAQAIEALPPEKLEIIRAIAFELGK